MKRSRPAPMLPPTPKPNQNFHKPISYLLPRALHPAMLSFRQAVVLMTFKRVLWPGLCGLCLIGGLFAFQKPFRVYPSYEPADDIPLPTEDRKSTRLNS